MNNIDYILVGLGNPGKEYEKTRHNIGFMALDFVSKKLSIDFNTQKFKSCYGVGNFGDKKVILLKPQTFMNLSGQAVVLLMSFYKVPPENVILIYDDISLSVGKMRIRKQGSHGGHNGVKNIVDLSGTKNFPRIKIGVGDKPNENWDLADWVLSKFSKDEMDLIENDMSKVYDALSLMTQGKIDQAMNDFNR